LAKRVTPIEEFERFAERLYNYNPYIQTRLDFDKSFEEYLEDLPKSKVLREKTWDIMKDKFVNELPEGVKQKNKVGRKQNIKVEKQYPKDYVAKFWDKKTKHYQVKYVSRIEDKSGRVRYLNGDGKWVKPVKVQKADRRQS